MKSKTIASLLTMTLLLAFVSASLPLTAIVHADDIVIKWLTHWDSVKEQGYWQDVINYYETNVDTGVDIQFYGLDFDAFYEEITLTYSTPDPSDDPDMIHMHSMWIPAFANWMTNLLAIPPPEVQANIIANYSTPAVDGVTWKGIVWGIPTEYNTWALVYDRVLIENATLGLPPYTDLSVEDRAFLSSTLTTMEARNPYQPITWDDLKRAARLLTVWNATDIVKSGFLPFVDGMPEEERFGFMTLLWSNGGEYLDLSVPEVSFDDNASGSEVLQLYYDLGWGAEPTYDPTIMENGVEDYWWTSWELESVAMMVLPTWMQYIREAMVDNFYNMGATAIPTGPSLPNGEDPTSLAYGWVLTVTQTSVNQGRSGEAWEFINWLNQPRPAGYIPEAPSPNGMRIEFGPVPRGDGCSILGDYLITDSIIPSRLSDQTTGRVLLGYEQGDGYPGDQIMTDFWFKGFIDIANIYGRPDKPFITSEEVQAEIGLMIQNVVYFGTEPEATIAAAADAIQGDGTLSDPGLLPMAGDITINGQAGPDDVSPLIVDFVTGVTPASGDAWYRGRSDTNDDNIINTQDLTILSTNYWKYGAY